MEGKITDYSLKSSETIPLPTIYTNNDVKLAT